jgi:putative CGCGG family rSAM target protein
MGLEHDHDGVAPVTDHVQDNSWSGNLETPDHAADQELVLAHARKAIEYTAADNHVDAVTHGDHGHPREYLYDHLSSPDIEREHVEQCGCGGHVICVHVR